MQAKATILALLDDLATGDEVEITKHGRTVARLVPATGPHPLKGSLVGVAMTAGKDEDVLLDSHVVHWWSASNDCRLRAHRHPKPLALW